MDLKLVKYVVFSLAFWMTFSLPAQAAGDVSGNNCDWQDAASTVWEATKDAAGSAGSWLKDKGTEIYEAGKEKAPEVKENIQNGVQQAGDEFSEFRADQEDQFWDWFENQTNSEVTSEPSAAPTDEAENIEAPLPNEAEAVELAPVAPTEIAPEEIVSEEPRSEEVAVGDEPDEPDEFIETGSSDESATLEEPKAEHFTLEVWHVLAGALALASLAALIGETHDRRHRH